MKLLIKKGDFVRISKITEAEVRKNKFEKKYTINWSNEFSLSNKFTVFECSLKSN